MSPCCKETLDAMEALAARERATGDGRALRVVQRLRAELEKPEPPKDPAP